jgi:CHAT domain-containing protein
LPLRTLKRSSISGLPLFAMAAATSVVGFSTAASAATPQQLCGAQAADAALGISSIAALEQATNEAEVILASLRDPMSGDRALNALIVADGGEAATNAAALAAYCSAAGEAMRVARSGSGNRAQTFLVNALSLAEGTGGKSLTARIAYRLALGSRNLPVRPNARSAKRANSRSAQPIQVAISSLVMPPAEQGISNSQSNNVCSSLLGIELADQSNWAVSKLALECAAESAQGAGLANIAAVSRLQVARITLAEAGLRAEDRDLLQEDASIAAIAGLNAARDVGDRAFRFELTARLIETTLDANHAGHSRINTAFTDLANDASSDPAEQAMLNALRGRMMLAAGEPEQAAALLRRAVFFESQRKQPLRLADWYLHLSDAAPEQREAYVMQAYQALEAVRPLLPSADPITEESLFKLRMQPVFNAAVDVQLSQGAAGENGAAATGRVLLAQQIVESFRQAEIQYVFGPDCVPPRVPVSPADLRVGEILLYPILLNDRVEMLYAAKTDADTQPKYQRYTVTEGANLDRIESLVKQVSYELGYGFDDTWQDPAAELYSLLIKPIEDTLGKDTTLVIVPDGILRKLPFGALRDENGTMLIEKTRLSIAPSLAYTQPGTDNHSNTQIVAASLSKAVDLPAGFFPALEATSAEAQMAAGLGNADKAVGVYINNFSRDDLVSAFSKSKFDVLHLATHASFNGRSDRSFIVSDGEAILLSELRELIGSSLSNGELLSLIILSACETAVGDDQASMGLAGAAVQAGSESAIASLWEVDDAGTARLMKEFYQFYAQGQGKAEALRNAQLAMIAEGGGLADPGIWAAFTLLGAWR